MSSVCDLCNAQNISGSIEEHLETSHGNFMVHLETFLATEPPAPTAKDTLDDFGKRVLSMADKLDGGAAVFEQGLRVHQQLAARVENSKGLKNCKLFTFGSCVSMGCWDGKGDIDFTLVDCDGWVDGSWPPADEGAIIMNIASVLRNCGFLYNDIEPVTRARVPVAKVSRSKKFNALNHSGVFSFVVLRDKMKPFMMNELEKHPAFVSRTPLAGGDTEFAFKDGETAMSLFSSNKCKWSEHPKNLPECLLLDFDMSCRAHGIRNSWFMRQYLAQSGAARVGNVFLKKWSKLSGVNNPKKGYLTSYAMSILWVYYLLHVGHIKFIDPKSVPEDPRKNPSLVHIPLLPEGPKERLELSRKTAELIKGFFKFYGYDFDLVQNVVSLCRESPTTKETLGWTLDNEIHSEIFRDRVWYRFSIEDPYEANLSLGRHLSPVKSSHVVVEFRKAYKQCLEGDLDGLLEDRSQTTIQDTIQRVVASIISEVGPKCTILDVITAIKARSPSMIPAFEASFQALDLVELSGLNINGKGGLTLKKSFNARPAEVQNLLKELKEGRAAKMGIKLENKHEGFNPRLFWLGASSRRLFTSRNAMETFDEHFIELHAVCVLSNNAPTSADELKHQASGRLSREADDAIFNEILADSRFYRYEKRKSGEVLYQYSKKTGNEEKFNHNIRDVTRTKYGKCDYCSTRGPITGASDYVKDSGFYCDKCWQKY